MFLASNAFQAGSLTASQPGLTIVDPLVASVLGVVLFGERLNVGAAALAGEFLAFAVLVASVIVLSRSPLVQDEANIPTHPTSYSGHSPNPSKQWASESWISLPTQVRLATQVQGGRSIAPLNPIEIKPAGIQDAPVECPLSVTVRRG